MHAEQEGNEWSETTDQELSGNPAKYLGHLISLPKPVQVFSGINMNKPHFQSVVSKIIYLNDNVKPIDEITKIIKKRL